VLKAGEWLPFETWMLNSPYNRIIFYFSKTDKSSQIQIAIRVNQSSIYLAVSAGKWELLFVDQRIATCLKDMLK